MHIIVIGAGCAGLMAARELAFAGEQITILEAAGRIGGRVLPLEARDFGYSAEGGAEFIHGEAPVTTSLVREAGLTLLRSHGERWGAHAGAVSRGEMSFPHADRLHDKLRDLKHDLPIAQFLDAHFGGKTYAVLRASIVRMVEGYDAADPARASTLALRDEWMGGDGVRGQGRIEEGYGALLRFLESECRKHGAALRLNAEVKAIEVSRGKAIVRRADGGRDEADAVVVTVPPPILRGIAFAPALAGKIAAAADIGYGNVIKILLRFERRWWVDFRGQDLARMSFLFSDGIVPTWWTQYPRPYPVLTGWLAGPRTEKMTHLSSEDLVETGVASLARAFDLPVEELRRQLTASRAIDWGQDPFARGAYSYATPETKAAQAELLEPVEGVVFFSGEALYQGKDMGTVEAAFASGKVAAATILRGRANRTAADD